MGAIQTVPKKPKKTFISVVRGKFSQGVDQSTPGATMREYEDKKTGEKKEKWELTYDGWTGFIRKVEFVNGEYGKNCHIELDDVVISLQASSKNCDFFNDFAKRLKSIDLSQELAFYPYDFKTEEGKINKGIAIYYGKRSPENKITNGYRDADSGTWDKRFPNLTKKEAASFDGDDWQDFYGGPIRKFLIGEVLELFPEEAPTAEAEAVSAVAAETFSIEEATSSEVKPDDLPF